MASISASPYHSFFRSVGDDGSLYSVISQILGADSCLTSASKQKIVKTIQFILLKLRHADEETRLAQSLTSTASGSAFDLQVERVMDEIVQLMGKTKWNADNTQMHTETQQDKQEEKKKVPSRNAVAARRMSSYANLHCQRPHTSTVMPSTSAQSYALDDQSINASTSTSIQSDKLSDGVLLHDALLSMDRASPFKGSSLPSAPPSTPANGTMNQMEKLKGNVAAEAAQLLMREKDKEKKIQQLIKTAGGGKRRPSAPVTSLQQQPPEQEKSGNSTTTVSSLSSSAMSRGLPKSSSFKIVAPSKYATLPSKLNVSDDADDVYLKSTRRTPLVTPTPAPTPVSSASSSAKKRKQWDMSRVRRDSVTEEAATAAEENSKIPPQHPEAPVAALAEAERKKKDHDDLVVHTVMLRDHQRTTSSGSESSDDDTYNAGLAKTPKESSKTTKQRPYGTLPSSYSFSYSMTTVPGRLNFSEVDELASKLSKASLLSSAAAIQQQAKPTVLSTARVAPTPAPSQTPGVQASATQPQKQQHRATEEVQVLKSSALVNPNQSQMQMASGANKPSVQKTAAVQGNEKPLTPYRYSARLRERSSKTSNESMTQLPTVNAELEADAEQENVY